MQNVKHCQISDASTPLHTFIEIPTPCLLELTLDWSSPLSPFAGCLLHILPGVAEAGGKLGMVPATF